MYASCMGRMARTIGSIVQENYILQFTHEHQYVHQYVKVVCSRKNAIPEDLEQNKLLASLVPSLPPPFWGVALSILKVEIGFQEQRKLAPNVETWSQEHARTCHRGWWYSLFHLKLGAGW